MELPLLHFSLEESLFLIDDYEDKWELNSCSCQRKIPGLHGKFQGRFLHLVLLQFNAFFLCIEIEISWSFSFVSKMWRLCKKYYGKCEVTILFAIIACLKTSYLIGGSKLFHKRLDFAIKSGLALHQFQKKMLSSGYCSGLF